MNQPLRTCLIGLGEIARHHGPGLEASDRFQLVAVCDSNPDAVSRPFFSDLHYYQDAGQMLRAEKPDVAIVASSPTSHASLVSLCASLNVFALVEKPLTTEPKDLDLLLSLLRQKKCDVLYHWRTAPEMLWLAAHARLLEIRRIHFMVEDPYLDRQGHVFPNRLFPGGCWLDSGVNVLSILAQWVDLSRLIPVRVDHVREEGVPVETRARFRAGDVDIQMDISWKTGRNIKQTRITTVGEVWVLDHSAQAVIRNGETCFEASGMERLTRHYMNVYGLYPSSLLEVGTTEQIHRILFENW